MDWTRLRMPLPVGWEGLLGRLCAFRTYGTRRSQVVVTCLGGRGESGFEVMMWASAALFYSGLVILLVRIVI